MMETTTNNIQDMETKYDNSESTDEAFITGMSTEPVDTKLKDSDIDQIVAAAKESVPDRAIDLRELKETVEVNPDADLVSYTGAIDAIGNEILDDSIDISLFDISDEDKVKEGVAKKAATDFKDNFNLTEEETMDLLELITEYKKDPNYPIYSKLPEAMKKMVREMAFQNGIPAARWNEVSRMILDEFVKDSTVEEALIDLEKALDEALAIPSVTDMYTEHIKDTMDNIIPKTIDAIKDEYPEKAETLQRVRDAFYKSYTFELAKISYDKNARLRKAIRRWEKEFDRTMNEFNFRNERSNFKMNDVTELYGVLSKILFDEPHKMAEKYEEDSTEVPENIKRLIDLDVTGEDICKFCILITKSCENMDPRDVVDASYMYYMMRNIIVLQYANEAKTDFSAELISNICNTIVFIRNREDEFNDSNLNKSKSRKSSTV